MGAGFSSGKNHSQIFSECRGDPWKLFSAKKQTFLKSFSMEEQPGFAVMLQTARLPTVASPAAIIPPVSGDARLRATSRVFGMRIQLASEQVVLVVLDGTKYLLRRWLVL